MACTDDIWRFKRSGQYCAYFGLTLKPDESGQCRRLGHTSKEGPSVARKLLCIRRAMLQTGELFDPR